MSRITQIRTYNLLNVEIALLHELLIAYKIYKEADINIDASSIKS